MPRLIEYVSVGICSSYQDGDYKISSQVADLSRESMQELRLAMVYAIYQMEEMWRKGQEGKWPAGKAQSTSDSASTPAVE